MKKQLNRAIILSVLVGFSGYSIQAYAGEQDASQPTVKHKVQNKTSFSPRAFCRAGEGSVTETNKSDIYLCCYKTRHKCLAIDINKSISWTVAYEAKDIGNVAPLLEINDAY